MIRFERLRHDKWASQRDVALVFVTGMLASMIVIGTFALVIEQPAMLNSARQLVGQLLPAGETSAWYLSRASGLVAYLFVSSSVIWGLALSTKIVKEWVAPPRALALHNTFSWMAAGLAVFHAVVLLFDGYFDYSISALLIPFTGPYRPASVGLGIISLYGLLLVAVSFRARKWIGQRIWRQLHYTSFALYVLITAHGLTAGTDARTPAVYAIYVGSTVAVLFLVNYRLLILPKLGTTKGTRPIAKAGSSIPTGNAPQK